MRLHLLLAPALLLLASAQALGARPPDSVVTPCEAIDVPIKLGDGSRHAVKVGVGEAVRTRVAVQCQEFRLGAADCARLATSLEDAARDQACHVDPVGQGGGSIVGVGDSKSLTFLGFLRRRGAFIPRALRIRPNSYGVRGLLLDDDNDDGGNGDAGRVEAIPAGGALISLPASVLWNSKLVARSRFGDLIGALDEDSFDGCSRLVIHIMLEAGAAAAAANDDRASSSTTSQARTGTGKTSFDDDGDGDGDGDDDELIRAYLRFWPAASDMGQPHFFKAADLALLHEQAPAAYGNLVPQVRTDRRSFQALWPQLLQLCETSAARAGACARAGLSPELAVGGAAGTPKTAGAEQLAGEQLQKKWETHFYWALAIVRSRMWSNVGGDRCSIVPVGDFLNHRTGAARFGVDRVPGVDAVVVRVGQAFTAGQEIEDDYDSNVSKSWASRLCDGQVLFKYGFATGELGRGCVSVSVGKGPTPVELQLRDRDINPYHGKGGHDGGGGDGDGDGDDEASSAVGASALQQLRSEEFQRRRARSISKATATTAEATGGVLPGDALLLLALPKDVCPPADVEWRAAAALYKAIAAGRPFVSPASESTRSNGTPSSWHARNVAVVAAGEARARTRALRRLATHLASLERHDYLTALSLARSFAYPPVRR